MLCTKIKGPLSSGGPYPFGEYLNRDLGDNSGTSYEILAPGGRFMGSIWKRLGRFSMPDPFLRVPGDYRVPAPMRSLQ